jgi:VIT1/CCC1 family predicted Fe2+/Mn2+ transporter
MTEDPRRYREFLQDERDSAALYRALAEREPSPQLAEVYRRLADAEAHHAARWAARLRAAGAAVPPERPRWRTRVLLRLARRYGPELVVPALAGRERAGAHAYVADPAAQGTPMAAEERSHARILGRIAEEQPGGIEGSALARFEGRHRAPGGNALRAAVLGANDGLVSNLSLVMGVAGAALSETSILVTGLAGLLAGAGSMAMGEWLSVQSSRELHLRQIAVEEEELAANPEEERAELVLIYQAKGLPPDQAEALADRLVADPASALDTLAREELGVDPEELGGSAWEAAWTSFVLFAIGAVIPVAPFALLTGTAAVVASLAASGLALFAIGAGITLLTGRSVWASGLRQLGIGLGAALLTFAVGRLIGVAVVG